MQPGVLKSVKILLYSHAFWPSIGGVERVSHNLANGLVSRGHTVTLVTETSCENEQKMGYRVMRCLSGHALDRLVAEHDLVHSSGSSIRCFPSAWQAGKPFSWTHHGYQLQCIDGAGWVNGAPAPLTPLASMRHHARIFGPKPALIGASKVCARRLVGRLAAANVATSKHALSIQPLPRQRLIYNPADLSSVAVSNRVAESYLQASECTFTYVGRLVSEKGVDDLIHAFAQLSRQELEWEGLRKSTLKIIGDGPELSNLKKLASDLSVDDRICWRKVLLADESARIGISIIPSAWEEPGALIVLELMAAGKPLIVSQNGCLSECAGDAALTFPNRNREALLRAMTLLSNNKELQFRLSRNALERVKLFDPESSIAAYEQMFTAILGKSYDLARKIN